MKISFFSKVKIKIALFVVSCFFFQHISCSTQVHYISVGADCQIADTIGAFNLRKASFPFDWFVSRDFNAVTQVIEEDFNFLFDPNFLAYRPHWIENTRYGFLYNHFFKRDHEENILLNYLDELPDLKLKMDRRIERFQNLLQSEDIIVFIRTHTQENEANNFVNRIKTKYPKLKFLLIIVNHRDELLKDWDIPNVINFYACELRGVQDWWSYAEWDYIFNQVNDLLSVHYQIIKD